jgi:hypothetical protein
MGINRNGKLLPVKQILAYGMGPVLGNSRTNIIGIVLVKEVIFSFVIYQSVGITQESRIRGEMELRSKEIAGFYTVRTGHSKDDRHKGEKGCLHVSFLTRSF